jgi:oxygen-independent coproporphyrinogen-3 oxidase
MNASSGVDFRMWSQKVVFDPQLIRRYDVAGPRYTSYPTAAQFHPGFSERQYRSVAAAGNAARPPKPLSLYFHLPFCDTVCFYCACNKIVTRNRARAAPYLASLQREIELQAALFDRARVVEQLHWGGGTPTFLAHEQMRALMQTTRRHFQLRDDDGGEYSIEIDPREVGDGTLALLRELGFNRLSLGVQDFDPAVQRAVNRIQSEQQTLAVFHEAQALGFRSTNLDLIYGLPRQTAESFARTLEKIIAAAPDRLSIFNYAHLPTLFKTQRQINAAELPGPQTKLDILQLTIERLTAAGYLYIGMDHFAKPDDELASAQREGTLYRNFQGYSTHAQCDLIGMGVSAIGMVGDTYAQNGKMLSTYCDPLAAGKLPLWRGVVLNEDDRLRRAVISDLICHFRLDIPALERRFGIVFGDYFAPEQRELARLAQDGLLRLEPASIVVEPAGKLLIRPVCMVFDRYLREAQSTRFSRVI